MKYFTMDNIRPIDVKLVMGRVWITYNPMIHNNDEIKKGSYIYSAEFSWLEVDCDASYEDGYIAICKPFRPESFPLEFIKSLGVDDVVSKYVEWIKTN